MPYVTDWKPISTENTNFCCQKCKSKNVSFRYWESSDEAHEDTKYACNECGNIWWVEGSDY